MLCARRRTAHARRYNTRYSDRRPRLTAICRTTTSKQRHVVLNHPWRQDWRSNGTSVHTRALDIRRGIQPVYTEFSCRHPNPELPRRLQRVDCWFRHPGSSALALRGGNPNCIHVPPPPPCFTPSLPFSRPIHQWRAYPTQRYVRTLDASWPATGCV